MQNIDFDKRVKELMDEHQEMPPFDSWEKISSALDRKRARMAYFRRGIYVISAVAASLLLMLVINRDLPEGLTKSQIPAVLSENKPLPQCTVVEETQPRVTGIHKFKRAIEITSEKLLTDLNEPVAGKDEECQTNVSGGDKSVKKENKLIKEKGTYTPVDFGEDTEVKSFKEWLRERKYKYALSTNLSSSVYKKSINLVSVSLGYQNDFIPSSLKESVRSQYVSDRNYAMPVTFGVQVQTDINKKISIGTGITYTLLSSNYQEISTTYSRDIEQMLHYIGVPLNGYYNLFENKSLRLYVTAGAMLEKGIVASYRENTDGVKKYYSKSISGVQFSAGAGLGVEWKLSNDVGIYIDPAMSYYFKGNQPSCIRTAQPLQYKFEMGMRFEI